MLVLLTSSVGQSQQPSTGISPDSLSISVNSTDQTKMAMWSDPVPIALLDTAEFEAQAHPRAVASNGHIYLVFEGVSQFGDQLHADIYTATYSSTGWSRPVNISQSSVFSGYPQIGLFDGDDINQLTVFWGEQRGESPIPDFFPLTDSYFTAHNSGERWSAPDKIFQSQIRGLNFTNIVRDEQGQLHYTFLGRRPDETRSIFYIHKKSEQGWSQPQLIHRGGSYSNLIALDNERLMLALVTSDTEFARNQGADKNSLFVMISEDGGLSWGERKIVHQAGQDHPAHDPFLMVDANDVIHLFWLQNPPGQSGLLSKKVMRTMSTDGKMWHQTEEFLTNELLELGSPDYFSSAVTPDGRIFLVFRMVSYGSSNHLLFSWWDGNEWKAPRRILEDYDKFYTPKLIYNESDQHLHLIVSMGVRYDAMNRSLYHSTYPLISDPGDS